MKGSAVRIRASALADLQGNRLGQRSSLARGFGTFPSKSVFEFVLKPRARTRLTLGLGPCRSDLSRLERIAGSTSLDIRGGLQAAIRRFLGWSASRGGAWWLCPFL